MRTWHVYLVQCADGSLYTGIALQPERRVHEHNHVKSRASKYCWARRPVVLRYYVAVGSQAEALRRERYVKRCPAHLKEGVLRGWE